ncbi:sulfotransferase [Sphingomonas sp. AOB5]|uniref:sulfotransferase n=1 Tax=Sphingomonas sp. AOB5 TaxID=3034017 RepID=UPI0023F9E1D2|nr:sulfotransferase [Sphingomonas sp. AOB5]MDF7773757.1 sulfotransferase [Sphingomonas sp. AOB5]
MYSRADRILHHIALGFRPVLEASFDIERARYRRALNGIAVEAPVFVSGLARAGTTVLMRALHASGGFASLSYRDMPFPLAPNSWARLGRGFQRHVETSERGHGDGLTHDLDSPEAIEEVFWRMHEGDRYRTREALLPEPVAPDTIAAFRDYVRLVLLRHGGPRYLSKNNNNVLRLPALVAAFPDAVLLHPFRDPLQQAISLRTQHVRADKLAAEDPFRRRYMSWLGHHEFGADQRPFGFEGAPGAGESRARIDYWLKGWISVHRALLAQPEAVAARQRFLDYDRLCADSAGHEAAFARAAGLERAPSLSGLAPPPLHAEPGADPGRLAQARAVLPELQGRAVVAA